MQNSLERIDPDSVADTGISGYETLQLHLQRYQYATRFIKKGNCADIACGTGYGSFFLASTCGHFLEKIIAIDIDQSSIDRGRSRYAHPAIEFICSDALQFKSPQPLDQVISLETIEHLPDPQAFVNSISRQLQKKGLVIASVPITPSMDANPFHLHDFTKPSFLKLFHEAGLVLIDSIIQVQPYKLFSVLGRKDERSKDLRKDMIGYYLKHPSKFFLRLKSILKDGFTNKYIVAVFEKS